MLFGYGIQVRGDILCKVSGLSRIYRGCKLVRIECLFLIRLEGFLNKIIEGKVPPPPPLFSLLRIIENITD
jgi:hypothetical protein